MISTHSSRRDFVTSTARLLGGGWIATSLPLLAALSACARDAAERGDPFTTLSAGEGRTLAAFAAQVFPTDGTPGATEAGVAHFIDQGLGGYFGEMRELFRTGLAELDRHARALDSAASSFADLTPERQMEVMRKVEDTPFFGAARMLTVMGMFSDPRHGGNRNGVGWTVLGLEPHATHQPPFGYYDAEYARQQSGETT